jgi:hypothetical protein
MSTVARIAIALALGIGIAWLLSRQGTLPRSHVDSTGGLISVPPKTDVLPDQASMFGGGRGASGSVTIDCPSAHPVVVLTDTVTTSSNMKSFAAPRTHICADDRQPVFGMDGRAMCARDLVEARQ